jgi:hypothetical protein
MHSTSMLSASLVFALLVLFMAMQGVVPAIGGQAMPNVSGKWQGAWSTRGGNSGQITLQLVQEGNKVIG